MHRPSGAGDFGSGRGGTLAASMRSSRSSVPESVEELPEEVVKQTCKVPVLLFIVVGMCVSTAASLAGGLILYFESVASLEASVKETSEGEVASLRDSVVAVLDKTAEVTGAMKKMTYSLERINTNNSEEWVNLTRSLWYSLVSASPILYSCGVSLVPFDKHDGSVFYSGVWGDLRRDGTQEYVHGHYASYLNQTEYFPKNATGTVQYMWIPTWTLFESTGYINQFLYMWDGSWSYLETLSDWNPKADPSVPATLTSGLYDWDENRRAPGAVGSRWWRPGKWYSSDFLYTFTEMESVYIPPPAPHPWSRYRAVVYQVGFLYQSWVAPFVEYKRSRPDTTALIVDRVTTIVYVSTTGDNMIPERCQTVAANVDVDLECASRVENLPEYLQQAYVKFNAEPFDVFTKLTLDGEEYFARKTHIFRQAELFWLRPMSSINSKVQQALVLLIIFTSVVVAVDVLIGVFEVLFIALPLRRVSQAVSLLGDMETEAARYTLRMLSGFAVFEISNLNVGMQATSRRLEEYRAFMPLSLRATQPIGIEIDGEVVDAECSTSASSATPKSESLSTSRRGAELHVYISSRRIALLLVNVVGWVDVLKNVSEEEVLNLHEGLIATVMEYIANGVVDSFCADRFLVGWNTVVPQGDHVNRCLTSVFRIKCAAESYTMSFGVAAGKAKVGNMGTRQMRRFTILSDCVPWVMQMEAFNKLHKLTCCVDETLFSQLGLFVHRVVDGLRHPKSGRVLAIYNVIKLRPMEVTEWMYDLELDEGGDILHNELALAVIHEKWSAVARLQNGRDGKGVVEDEIFRAATEQRHFSPLFLGFPREWETPEKKEDAKE